jgi:hypothetical protein
MAFLGHMATWVWGSEREKREGRRGEGRKEK